MLDSNGESYEKYIDSIFLALAQIRFTTYAGFRNRLTTDKGSEFKSS